MKKILSTFKLHIVAICTFGLIIMLSSCSANPATIEQIPTGILGDSTQNIEESTPVYQPKFTERPNFSPGELVAYTVRTGDNLHALASRFNTSVEDILIANPTIPKSATTLPPGLPMQIPIYYEPFWGPQFVMLPDSLFINGPSALDFSAAEFVANSNGWLIDYSEFINGKTRNGGEIIEEIALNYSIDPRVYLAWLEYRFGALSKNIRPEAEEWAFLIAREPGIESKLTSQLGAVSSVLNDAFYSYREGKLDSITLADDAIVRSDPWQNAGTIALHMLFSLSMDNDQFFYATSPEGFYSVYLLLFGEPSAISSDHIPGSLIQPPLLFPFELGTTWAYTGGPHTAWGSGEPYAAIDFAPPSARGGCIDTDEWTTAMSDGVIARSETGIVVLDLDGDGDERTGWNIFYLHMSTKDRIEKGEVVSAGDKIGHPSCERGTSTGTHTHIARKYNGEWIVADGVIPFNLEDWVVSRGTAAYLGTLTKYSQVVTACVCSNRESHIIPQMRVDQQ